ncbi:MAG TPA: 2-phospho-L-lactate guanylyltransferase [Solirubrobacteraceae bacterium]|nr:2-phospho-L-lactate guanylyltransferase [Solirubrobacteraceae bacterium]
MSVTAAVLPVKRFGEAKQRLGDALHADERASLAQAMVVDVLDALHATPALGALIVVTAEPSVAAALQDGATLVHDHLEGGQSAAASLGIARAIADGAERVVLVPGDCPALDPEELGALLGVRGPGVTIVPDRHGTGTNALVLEPPDAIAPSFGPGSFERHLAAARAAGLPHRVQRPATLLLDVDTGADLQALRERLAAHPGRAVRTRAALASR